MASIDDILYQAAVNPELSTDNPDLAVATVDDVEIISFSPESALLLVTLAERASLFSSLMRTHTVVLKTSDGGESWRLTLDTTTGSVVKEEVFFLDETHGWFVTQWQVEGTFPTLYGTTDFGETWQESSAINDFLAKKGHGVTANIAEGVRFNSATEGIILASSSIEIDNGKPVYFLKTTDAGKSCTELENLPPEYFTWKSQHRNNFTFNDFWTIKFTNSGVLVEKSLGEFSRIYQPASNPL